MNNLYRYDVPDYGETFDTLLSHKNVRIVRIVSSEKIDTQHVYRQSEEEWFVLLEGEAVLELDDKIITLHKGDTLFIPAQTPHRVLKTKHGTLWLAVHID